MNEVVVNGLGTNANIEFNFDEKLLREYGFKFIDEPNYPDTWSIPPHWVYFKVFHDRNAAISFYITYYLEEYKGAHLEIITIDDDFGQPYDYQMYLDRNPNFAFALRVQDFVEVEMKKLTSAGIISRWEPGDYI